MGDRQVTLSCDQVFYLGVLGFFQKTQNIPVALDQAIDVLIDVVLETLDQVGVVV